MCIILFLFAIGMSFRITLLWRNCSWTPEAFAQFEREKGLILSNMIKEEPEY